MERVIDRDTTHGAAAALGRGMPVRPGRVDRRWVQVGGLHDLHADARLGTRACVGAGVGRRRAAGGVGLVGRAGLVGGGEEP